MANPSAPIGSDFLNAILEGTQNRDDLVVNIAKLLQKAIEIRSHDFSDTRDVQITSEGPDQKRVLVKDHDGETDVTFTLQHKQKTDHKKGITAQHLIIGVDVKPSALIGQDHKRLADNITSALREATLRKIDLSSIKDSLIKSHSTTNGMRSTTLRVHIDNQEIAKDTAQQATNDRKRTEAAEKTLGSVIGRLTTK